MANKTMKAGQAAAAAGVHVETLRYYERRGILKEQPRRPSGYREYSTDAVRVVKFVKRAQGLGFTLSEVQELLIFRDAGEQTCADVRDAAAAKIEDIQGKIESLGAMKRALDTLVDACDSGTSARRCPILESLDDGEQESSSS